jgi:hypothetical protein
MLSRAEDVVAVLAEGGEVASDAERGLRGGLGAVAAADLPLGPRRTDVSLGLVVGERHAEIAREQQQLVVAFAQAFEQAAGLGRRCSASPTSSVWRRESSSGCAISGGIAGNCWSRAW